MSTRSMTVLKGKHLTINLYRHCDGYPAEAGQSLLGAVKACRRASVGEIAELLLQPTSNHKYELVDYPPEHRGDLEHVYVLEGPQIKHRAFTREGWVETAYTFDEFQAFVALKQAKRAERYAQLRAAGKLPS